MNLNLWLLAAAAEPSGSIEKSVRDAGTMANKLAAWFDAQKEHLILALGIVAVGIVAAIVAAIVLKFAGKGAAKLSDLAGRIVGSLAAPVAWVLVLAGLSLGNNAVDLPGKLDGICDKILYALFIIVIVWGVMRVFGACDDHISAKRAQKADSGMDKLVADLMRRAAKTVVWAIAILFIAQNLFALNVTALITGAGVAGLAIAFAAQNTIANIFGALSIVTDKIFKIGDFIDVGGKRGTVEEVGFRSTKLRSLDGTVWNLPNRVVTDAAIENISKRGNIKYTFTLSLVYQTTPAQMKQALEILKEIFGSFHGFDQEKFPAKFSFSTFNASSLDIGVIVWFNTRNFMEAQGMKQEINLAILERFAAAGLSFAYPTVTNYLVNAK